MSRSGVAAVSVMDSGRLPAERTSARRRFVRLLPLAGVFAVVLGCFALVGRYGFNPTDEGLITSASYRLLHAQVPHLDIISARPLGSPLLHTIDLVLPTPLVLTSRVIACLEVITYSALFGALAFGVTPWRWGVAEAAAVTSAALVNLHTFPLMAWHTMDGLLCCSVGLYLLRAGQAGGRGRRLEVAFFALGAAALMKQSFAAAPVLGLVWARLGVPRDAFPMRRLLQCTLVASLPTALYVGVVAASGGLADARSQLTGGRLVTGSSLLHSFDKSGGSGRLFLALAIVLGGLTAAALARRGFARAANERSRHYLQVADLSVRTLLTGYVVWLTIGDHLVLVGRWGVTVLWVLVGVLLWRVLIEREVDPVGVLTVVVGWMASLSWGYAVPNLVGGTLALVLVDRIWLPRPSGPSPSRRGPGRIVRSSAALLVLAMVGAIFLKSRADAPYRDQPRTLLTANLGAVHNSFSGIRTNWKTARYMQQITNCIRRYPARRVAVLPDNAVVYGALELNNPFPIDWMYPPELVGSERRILQIAEKISREGDYLVLFQTAPADTLATTSSPLSTQLTWSEPTASTFFYNNALGPEIFERLHGTRERCGTFLAVHNAARR